MSYSDFLSSTAQAMVLGRSKQEQRQLLEHAIAGLEVDEAELDEQVDSLRGAGLETGEHRERRAAVRRELSKAQATLKELEAN
jgi:hypothetical protein